MVLVSNIHAPLLEWTTRPVTHVAQTGTIGDGWLPIWRDFLLRAASSATEIPFLIESGSSKQSAAAF